MTKGSSSCKQPIINKKKILKKKKKLASNIYFWEDSRKLFC